MGRNEGVMNVTVRNVGGAILGLMLVLMASCDDNPLAEDRDQAAYFRLNPVDVAVNAGGTVFVDAVVVNQFGAGTNEAVTGTPCDNKITAEADTARTAYELPERFRVVGVTLGLSCLIVRGGGLTDTVNVRVVPASIQLVGVDSLLSGNTSTAQVRFLNEAGQPVSGLVVADVTLASSNTSIAAVTATGAVTAMAPGTTTITATLASKFGVTRTGTVNVRVVPGTFAGTVAQTTYQGGHALVFTAGALAFDADTEARPRSPFQTWYVLAPTTPTTARALLPFGLAAGTVVGFDIVNLGAGQVAQGGSFTLTQATPAQDTQEPDASAATPKSMEPGTDYFGSLTAADIDDYIKLTITTAGSYTVTAHWNDGSDVDLFVLNSALSASLLTRATLANPETGTVTLAVGTYYIDMNMYEKTGAAPATYRVRVTRN